MKIYKHTYIFYLILLFSFFSYIGWSEDILSAFEIEGANFTYDIETGKIVSEGTLTLKSKDFFIEANRVVFDTEDQILEGKNGIKIKIGDINIEGKSLKIDFKKGIGEIIEGVRIQGKEKDKEWEIKGKIFLIEFLFNEKEKVLKEISAKEGGEFVYDDLKGNADKIKYLPLEKKIIFLQNVKIIKGKNTMIASNVTIDLTTKKIITKGKVRIIVNK